MSWKSWTLTFFKIVIYMYLLLKNIKTFQYFKFMLKVFFVMIVLFFCSDNGEWRPINISCVQEATLCHKQMICSITSSSQVCSLYMTLPRVLMAISIHIIKRNDGGKNYTQLINRTWLRMNVCMTCELRSEYEHFIILKIFTYFSYS